MRSPRKTTDTATHAKLDDAAAVVRQEAEAAETDPFDDAMVAAVAGLTETLKAEGAAMAELDARLGKTARRVAR